MSDYLSDLVTKNIGTADVIQPRRPTRFEPVQTTFALEPEIEPTSFQMDFFEEEQPIERMPPARPRRREVRFAEKNEETSSRKDSVEQIERHLLVTPPETRSSETKKTDARVTLAPIIIEAPPETKGESSSISNLLSPTPLTPITPLPPPKFVENRENSNDTNEFTPIQTRRSPPETSESKISPAKNSEQQTIEARDRIVIEPRVEKVENRVEQSTINQTIMSPPQAPRQISERAEVTEIPTINVTIGRVEVRAAVSSAPPKQAHSKPQTLSLDEYLHKRRTGGEK